MIRPIRMNAKGPLNYLVPVELVRFSARYYPRSLRGNSLDTLPAGIFTLLGALTFV